jgi:GMP synthase (glutamine-hydrolysing)
MGPVRALVLQHIACEPPGLYEDILTKRGITIERVELDEGGALPAWRDFDQIIAMGGPMSVNDDATLPWLTAEKRLIADAVRNHMPFFGACLGAQLLAAALGARVYPGPTDAGRSDPVTRVLPPLFFTVQFHGETFDIPEGGSRLAESDTHPNQAFRWDQAYGVQFHLEVTASMVAAWLEVPAYAEYLEQTLGPGGGHQLLYDVESHAAELSTFGRRLFARWMDLVVPTPSPIRV